MKVGRLPSRPKTRLVTLESDKATMDVPAPFVREQSQDAQGQGRRQGVRKGRVVLTLVDGRGHRRSVRSALLRLAATRGSHACRERRRNAQRHGATGRAIAAGGTAAARVDEASFVATRTQGPGVRKLARERGVDLGSVKGQRRQGTHPEGRRRGVRRRWRGACAESGAAQPPARRPSVGVDLLPWPKIDFAKFGPIERSRCRGSRRSPAPTCIATG